MQSTLRFGRWGAAHREIADLGDLAAGGVLVQAEVGAAVAVAGLADPPTAIARDDAVVVGRLHEGVEGRVRHDVGEAAERRVDDSPARGPHSDLAQLAARHLGVRAEVGPVAAIAGLVWLPAGV